jgi:membrane protease YdiL (CAAX protease family)
MTERRKRLFFLAIFALVFYVVGAPFVQSFVNYPTWRIVGVEEFNTYYQELSSRIIRIMVLPGVVEITLTVVLLWLRPRGIPRWPIGLALGLVQEA